MPRNWLFALVCLLFLPCATGLVAQSQPAVALPANNPYRPAFDAYARLEKADRDALYDGKPLSPKAAPLLDVIARSLAVGRTAQDVDWGIDYTKPGYEIILPHINIVQQLSKAVVARNETLPGAKSSALVDASLDALALARHVGHEDLFISLLVQYALEGRINAQLAARLPELASADAARFLSGLKTLPVGGDLATAVMMEKNIFIDAVAHDVRELFSSLATPSVPNGLAGRLRVAGIVCEQKKYQIGLELDNDSFWLKPGQARRGVTLLSVRPASDEAVLLADGHMLVLRLSARTISELDVSQWDAALKKLPPNNPLAGLIPKNSTDGIDFLRNFALALQQIDQLYADFAADPDKWGDPATYETRVKTFAPLAQQFAETLPAIAMNEKRSGTIKDLLIAAVQAAANGQSPSSQSGYTVKNLPEGSYQIESTQLFKNKPVSLTVGKAPEPAP